ncbi:MAG TPA: hypothetical protein PLD63_06980 [Ignavibacteria bacterium]|nr:hypothetical protein [Ignavibacteria bacterium]
MTNQLTNNKKFYMKLFAVILIQVLISGNILYSQVAYDMPENYTSAFTEEGLIKYLSEQESKEKIIGTAVIPFEIQHECFVKLSIFDRTGGLYELLIDEYMYPGKYSVIFKPEESKIPEEFGFKLEESGKIYVNSFLIKK